MSKAGSSSLISRLLPGRSRGETAGTFGYDRRANYKQLAKQAGYRTPVPVPVAFGRRRFNRVAALLAGSALFAFAARPRSLPNGLFDDAGNDLTLARLDDLSTIPLPGHKPVAPASFIDTAEVRRGHAEATFAELAELDDDEGLLPDGKPVTEKPATLLARAPDPAELLGLNPGRKPEVPEIVNVPVPLRKPEAPELPPVMPGNKPKPPKNIASLTDPEAGKSKPARSTGSSSGSTSSGKNRTIVLHSVSLGEKVKSTYMRNGRYVDKELKRLNYVMRDRRTGGVKKIDPKLFDQLYLLSSRLGAKGRTIKLLSGYRSKRTNDLLRRSGRGVAKNSYHTRGQAIDFYIPGYRISAVHRHALTLSRGGVGYYPSSNFVHIDTGPVRAWPRRYNHIAAKYQRKA